MSGIAITFPSSPVEGQSYLAQNGFTYIYDGQKNRWKRGGEFVRAPKILTMSGTAVTTTGAGIATGPTGSLIYVVPGTVNPSGAVGVDSFKAYRTTDSYPNYTEIQVSISSAFSTVAYAATFADTTHSIPSGSLSGDTTYYIRARQLVGSNPSTASTGSISGYSANPVKFTTASVYIDTPTIVSIAGSTSFPVYQIGYASTTLPATVTYTGGGVNNLSKVEWKVSGPRNPDSSGNTALAEVGIGTHSSVALANALVLAMPFSGASGVGIVSDVNNAIRTASGASAGNTKTFTNVGSASTVSVGAASSLAHFYPSAAYFNGTNQYLTSASSSDFSMGTGDFTVEGWIYKPKRETGDPGLWTIGPSALAFDTPGYTNSLGMGVFQSGQYISVWNNNNYSNTPVENKNGVWYHFANVRRGGVQSLFIDGYLVWSIADTTNYTGTYLGIGAAYGSNYPGEFYMQDFKIYKGLAKYTESFTPPLPTYGTISYTTNTTGLVGVATTSSNKSTGDVGIAETSVTAANALVLAMPMNRTFGFQDINVAIRGLTSGASAGTAKTVGLGTTSTANAPSHPRISSIESKWYDGAAYFDGGDHLSISGSSDFNFGTGDFTVEFWMYNTSTSSAFRRWITSTTGGFGSATYVIRENDIGLFNYNNGNSTTVVSQIKNKWTHIANVRISGTEYLYVDGILVDSAISTANYTEGAGGLTIGGFYAGGEYYTGYFQDLKIYKGFAKYTANFTPPQPICGFTTDLAIQTGFTTTTSTGIALTSIVGLGSTSTLAFAADQTYAGITSITSSSGITTLPDSYSSSLVLALPLANITGVGNSFTNDRNTQIRSTSLIGGGTTKTITNSGVTTSTSVTKWYGNTALFNGSSSYLTTASSSDFGHGTGDFTWELWFNSNSFTSGNNYLLDRSAGNAGVVQYTGSVLKYFNVTAGTGSVLYTTGFGSNLSTNTWYHIAAVRKNGVTSLYLNGTLSVSAPDTHNYGTESLTVGAYGTGSQNYFSGYITDLRIYNGIAKYTTNFTPPPPMFGDYTRSTPNKIVFTPGSDYVLEARNTSGVTTSVYSATRQWGTKAKGGIYDPNASSLVLAMPMNNTTTLYDVTGQIKLETPTSSYSSGQTVASPSGSTYTNTTSANNSVTFVSAQSKYYGYSAAFTRGGGAYMTVPDQTNLEFGSGDFTIELWIYLTNTTNQYEAIFSKPGSTDINGILFYKETDGRINFSATIGGINNWNLNLVFGHCSLFANRWTHFAITRKDQISTGWVNGYNVATTTASGAIIDNSGALNIGRYTLFPGPNTYSFDGYLSDLRIYKGLAKYTQNFTPPNQIYIG